MSWFSLMPRRAQKMLELDACIKAFFKTFRESSRIGTDDEGSYYWNEREVQWELFRHLRDRAVSHRIGSKWWFHAEGTVEKPAWARWGARRRADIVMINHAQFRRWVSGQDNVEPNYEAMIELKLVWSGQGKVATSGKIQADLRKLTSCLRDHLTKEAHMILIDGLDRNGTPYYSSVSITKRLANLRMRPTLASRLHLWHWPDSDEPILSISKAHWRHYTAYV